MSGRPIAYHYTRPGRGTTVFDEVVVLDQPDVKVSLLDAYEGREVRAGPDVMLEPGAPILWFVFPGAWHDVGRFHGADGTFTGWYTNLCTPVEIEADRWASTDLFLDLWQPADGGDARWLDEDEFAEAERRGILGQDMAARARTEQARVSARAARRAWPPEIAREIGLARAQELIGRA